MVRTTGLENGHSNDQNDDGDATNSADSLSTAATS